MARRHFFLTFLLAAFGVLGAITPTFGDAFDRERSQRSVYGFIIRAHSRWAGGTGNGLSYGSAVAVSPWHVLTCGHCLKPRDGNYWIVHDHASIHCSVLERREDEVGACVLVTDQPLERWLNIGIPHEGWAIVVCLDGQHNVRLDAPPSRKFHGWLPSPVIQDGRVIGLLDKKAVCQLHGEMCKWFCLRCDHPVGVHTGDNQSCIVCKYTHFDPCRCIIPDEGEYSPIGDADIGRLRK